MPAVAQPNEGPQLTHWLGQAQRGDREAFNRLCAEDSRQRWLLLIATSLPQYLRSKVDPEDVLQDTLAQAWRDLGQLGDASTQGFHRWIAGVARDRVLDVIRYFQRGKRDIARERATASLSRDAPSDHHTPSKSAARREQLDKIAAVLDELSGTYRDVIRYRVLEMRTTDETATLMNKKPGNVRMTLQRALVKLRGLLDDRGIKSTLFRPP
jgi:RNA polymerase sigma factor (sigma-70 family)